MIKQFIKSAITVFFLMNLALMLNVTVFAQDIDENITGVKTPSQVLSDIGGTGEDTGLNPFEIGQHPDAPPDYEKPGVGAISSPLYFTLDLVKLLMSGVAILVIILMVVRLVINGTEEEFTRAKTGLIMGIVGFILIQISDVAVKNIFFGEYGEAFENIPSAKEFAKEGSLQLGGLIGLIHAFIASISVLIIIVRGMFLLNGMGNEEELTKAKNQIIYAAIGIILVGLSEVIVKGFIFPDNGQSLPDVNTGKNIIKSITNYLSGFIAILSFASLFYAGYRYVVSAGNDESTALVKRIFISATIALLLSVSAFAIINTFIQFEI